MYTIIYPLKRDVRGSSVADLQDALQLLLKQGALLADDEIARRNLSEALLPERAEQIFGNTTSELVKLFQKEHRLAVSGEVDAATANTLNVQLQELGAVSTRLLEGAIRFAHGMPAEQLKLRLYRRDFGGKPTLLKETTTLAGGRYTFAYDVGQRAASLEVRAVDNNNKEIPLSKPLNDLRGEARRTLNLVAPAALRPLPAEYQRLRANITPLVDGEMQNLGRAKENGQQQDLSVLYRASGWDARLIALAAIAERLATDADVRAVNLPTETLYGLLRAGLPSDKLMLAQVPDKVVAQALKKVREAGIVALTDLQMDEFSKAFTRFSDHMRLKLPVPGSNSSFGDLLKTSGLDDATLNQFARIYLRHQGSGSELWKKAREAGLDEAQIGQLQLQGKYAFLAANSEVMIKHLLNKGVKDPVELVEQDLHRATKWKAEIYEQAGIPRDRWNNLNNADRKALEGVTPPSYLAEDINARLDSYAEDMARKIRLSYPTHVLGHLLETDATFKLPASHDTTVKLLKSSSAQGFRLGETPASAFLKANPGVQAGMSDTEFQIAAQQMKTLQRVYQITPNNEAIPVLMNLEMISAYDVMAYSETAFEQRFSSKYSEMYKISPKKDLAKQIYRKSKQVSSVSYNLFAITKKLDSEPPIAGLSAPVAVRDSAKNELIKHYPTLESLFGSMDFCECEHCQSVLSPAAYLVDLLQFIDIESGVWGNFLAHWKTTHGNRDYPHQDNNGNPMTPYDVLIERRPDLPYIALTCENTHTALPYIDVVNEILEYYIANGKLTQQAAHDTGEVTTAELLAEPQYILPAAYDTLRGAAYPLNLPFDLWIETVRQFCEYFDTPLHRILEVLRPQDDLFAPAQTFDRAAIFMESLGLSPTEVGVFTKPDPLATWHELYGFMTAVEATTEAIDANGQRIDLNSAKALSRRLGVTYKEITEIVQTGFVNPELSKLSLLYKLGVSVADARFYVTHKALLQHPPETLSSEDQKRRLEVGAFAQGLTDLASTFKVQLAPLEAAIQAIPFDRVLVLADPAAGCNFDLTTLQYADGGKTNAIVFLRINFFVRLWRKLGWSIEETDRALTAFMPQSAPFDGTAANLAKQPLHTVLIYLAHLKTLDEKVNLGKQSRLRLLTLWSDIATTGEKPLYAQLFLSRSVLKTAPVFDHPLGQYLTAPNILLKDHVLAVQGALGLSADEILRILADVGQSFDNATLSLPTVSLLYRYGLLAKALKLTVRELIVLKQLSGLDPFKPLHPDPLATLNQDYPFAQTLEFVKVAEELKDSGLSIEDLDYLLRHRFDETGQYRPDRAATQVLLKTLAAGVQDIRAEHTVPDDPATLSDEARRQKLGLALPADVVARFTALMNNTEEFTVTRPVNSANQLNPSDFADESVITILPYNNTTSQQSIVHRGVLFAPQNTSLKNKYAAKLSTGQRATFETLLDAVQTQSQSEARAFFDAYLLKSAPGSQPTTGFLDAADFDLLLAPMPAGLSETQQQQRIRQQRTRLAQTFLPFLQARLMQEFIVQTLVAQTGADPVLVESLLADERLIAAPTALLNAFAAVAEPGVTARFYDSNNGTGATQASSPVTHSTDTALKDARDTQGNPLNQANSAQFEAYLEVPATGAYRFFVELDKQNTTAELRFAHLPEPVFVQGTAVAEPDTLGDQAGEYLELKAGVLYHFELDLQQLNGGDARLLVQGETLPKGSLAQLRLYPAANINAAERALILLNKALQLAQSLGLSERELRYLLTHAADFDNISLSELPTAVVSDTLAEQTATQQRFGRFRRLAVYAGLKRALAGGSDDIIDLFEANGTTAVDRLEKRVYPWLAKLTRRTEATIKASAEILAKAPSVPTFESEKPLLRLWEALQVIERFGVSPNALSKWTAIVSGIATSEQRFTLARDMKAALQARFEPETWLRAAQSIFDKLRSRQRDALVAYIMQQQGFERMEQLYEYFLIDPGMEPVVQTSRIRLAIASLQLFIQRCLLNLERKVHPSTINAQHWEWMKRYRVWEANRKIFLFPENWLEPEFRDDKTHLFTELEGTLLQGDVSSDLVEDAFLNYLRKLDELARLDICAMHIEDNSDPARRILHVFGRTYSQPHKYFYRRYAHQMWTSWEPVSAEIEGDHLAPVIWRDRLYLFWVTFMEKAAENPQLNGTNSVANTKLVDLELKDAVSGVQTLVANKTVEVQLHWSEYLQSEWTTRESGGFLPVISETVPANFSPQRVFIHVSKEYDSADGAELGVFIHLGGDINRAFYLAGRNSAPESESYGNKPNNPFDSANTVIANRYAGSGALKVSYQEKISSEPGKTPPPANPSLLQQGRDYTLLPCNNELLPLGVSAEAYQNAANPAVVKAAIESGLAEIAILLRPVFYQDQRHTFFVEPSVTETTTEEWDLSVTKPPITEPGWIKPDWWDDIHIIPEIPWPQPLPDPLGPWFDLDIDPESLINPSPDRDWLINPGTMLEFDGVLVGPTGQPGLDIPTELATGMAGTAMHINPGSGLGSGSEVRLTDASTFAQSGLMPSTSGLNVVGRGGFNSALSQNFNEMNRTGFGRNNARRNMR